MGGVRLRWWRHRERGRLGRGLGAGRLRLGLGGLGRAARVGERAERHDDRGIPVLRSLEENGLLESTVEPSVSGPPRRYYKITKEGRVVLGEWTDLWKQTKNFVDSILKG